MTPFKIAMVVCFLIPMGLVADTKRDQEKQLSEALREVHDRGADLYNAGDIANCHSMFRGGLIVAKGMLTDRPEIRKIIVDGMNEAEKLPSLSKKAFALHELIEKVRTELHPSAKKPAESIAIPPREVKPEPKPIGKVGEVNEGVIGRVLWQGKPLEGVEISFITLGIPAPRIFDTQSGPQGVYTIAMLKPGKYVVLLTSGPKCAVSKLPERYSTATTSPLIFDVKANGEKLDFMLQ